jgi:uncharacterized damage-inducible protein DinB
MKEQLFSTLENSRTYSIAIAEAMPEGAYNFKPQNAGWSFGELMHHIAYGISWWEENHIKGNETPWNQPLVKNNKQAIITALKASYDSLKNTVATSKVLDSKVNGFHSTIDHITHHRGQAVIYLRCKGINPPEYIY